NRGFSGEGCQEGRLGCAVHDGPGGLELRVPARRTGDRFPFVLLQLLLDHTSTLCCPYCRGAAWIPLKTHPRKDRVTQLSQVFPSHIARSPARSVAMAKTIRAAIVSGSVFARKVFHLDGLTVTPAWFLTSLWP